MDCVVGSQFEPFCLHHAVLANPANPLGWQIACFYGQTADLSLAIPVSVQIRGLYGRFWRSVSTSENAVPGDRFGPATSRGFNVLVWEPIELSLSQT
jgi:hypothetical protein